MLEVLIERHHLVKHFLRRLVERSHHEGSDGHLHIAQLANYWLELRVVYPVQRLDNLQVVVLFMVFINSSFNWSEVLLVA